MLHRHAFSAALVGSMLIGAAACQDSTGPESLYRPSTENALLSTATLPPGLVAAYSFDETSGSTITDLSGNGNTGTITNGVARTTAGRYNGALLFKGNGMVRIPSSASLLLASAMTLEAWVRPTVVDASWRDVVYKGNDNYYLMASSARGGVPAGGASFGNVNATTEAYAPSMVTTNTWTHLAVTYDGSIIRLYVNGAQVATRAKTGSFTTSSNPLTIGGNTFYDQYFIGRIDEVRVYKRSLAAAEIQQDMNTPLGGNGTPIAPGDTTKPTVAISSPQASGTYTTTATQVAMSGSASDNVGVTQVRWSNDRGGSGICTGTTGWSVSAIPLSAGTNVVTITAQDSANNVATASLTVASNPPAATATNLGITQQPSATATSGATFAQQPIIQLRDASNNAVAQSGVVVTTAIASGSGTLGGTTSVTTNASGVATFANLAITGTGAYTLRFTATGLTAATSNTISVTGAASTSAEPTPSGTIVLDTRAGGAQDIQKVTTITGARAYWTASGGVLNDIEFTTDYNGAGKHAFRIPWKANPGAESSYNDNAFYFATQPVLNGSVVIHLGRTTTGGGVGAIGSFVPVTNGGGMKRMLWLRQRDNSTDRLYWAWPTGGQTTQENVLSIDNRNFDNYFSNANYGVGVDVRWTFQLIPGNPGILRVWRNGVLVNNDTNAGIGTLGFSEFEFIATRFNATQDETEYWTDLVMWRP